VNASHEYVVNLIKKAGDTLVLKVVHVQPPQHLPSVTGNSSASLQLTEAVLSVLTASDSNNLIENYKITQKQSTGHWWFLRSAAPVVN